MAEPLKIHFWYDRVIIADENDVTQFILKPEETGEITHEGWKGKYKLGLVFLKEKPKDEEP